MHAQKGATLCVTPFGVDIVGITELVALVGALVGGITARQRKAELERLNEQLRKVGCVFFLRGGVVGGALCFLCVTAGWCLWAKCCLRAKHRRARAACSLRRCRGGFSIDPSLTAAPSTPKTT